MSKPQRFRKKPVVIEAMQWPVKAQIEADTYEVRCRIAAVHRWVNGNGGRTEVKPAPDIHVVVDTPEGEMRISPGDWIIRGVAGEFYPCKPDIFDATYEAVSRMTDSLPERMREAAEVLEEATARCGGGSTWDPVGLIDYASRWEAEDAAAAEREALVEELRREIMHAIISGGSNESFHDSVGNAARSVIANGWTRQVTE